MKDNRLEGREWENRVGLRVSRLDGRDSLRQFWREIWKTSYPMASVKQFLFQSLQNLWKPLNRHVVHLISGQTTQINCFNYQWVPMTTRFKVDDSEELRNHNWNLGQLTEGKADITCLPKASFCLNSHAVHQRKLQKWPPLSAISTSGYNYACSGSFMHQLFFCILDSKENSGNSQTG